MLKPSCLLNAGGCLPPLPPSYAAPGQSIKLSQPYFITYKMSSPRAEAVVTFRTPHYNLKTVLDCIIKSKHF